MNERIRELAREAGFYANPDVNKFQKFAELLIRECIEQCNVNFVGTVGSYPNAHNRGVKKCIDNIKEHFGVLE